MRRNSICPMRVSIRTRPFGRVMLRHRNCSFRWQIRSCLREPALHSKLPRVRTPAIGLQILEEQSLGFFANPQAFDI
jgi:hypothetical protein